MLDGGRRVRDAEAMPDAPMEVELKFVTPAARVGEVAVAIPELANVPPRPMSSVYFDTPKGALRRAGLTLRVRRSGAGFTQTVKNDGDGGLRRGEWEKNLGGANPDLAAARATPAGQVLTKSATVAPLFAVDVRRRTAEVVEGESRIELSLDEGQAKANGAEALFAELELELKDGPQWGLFALSRRLAAAGDLTLSFTTKAERGFALVHPPRSFAQKFQAPTLTKDMDCAHAFRLIALACLRQITANADRLRHRASPEVVHQLRVGLRRLRSLLTTFKATVADARTPAIKAELKWLTAELDSARNLDVLLQGDYRAALAQKEVAEGLKGLGARLRAARRIAYARAASAVESERFRRLLLDLLIWIEAGPWTGAPEQAKSRARRIDKFAHAELAKRWRKIVKRGRELETLDVEARHKLRIDAKKLRYAADGFEVLFGRRRRAKSFISALKDVQDTLGELNDIAVGERLTHEAAVGGGPELNAAFVAGRISGVQKARVGPLTRRARSAIDELAAAKPFWK